MWKNSIKKLISNITGSRKVNSISASSLRQQAMDQHLNLIHEARIKMVSTLLPKADIILDLGGANAPLYKMGYPSKFKKLILVDLPPEDRHEYYKEVLIDNECKNGEVVIKYNDMTELNDFNDDSVDFVWSGQSIEHIPYEKGRKMCEAVYRVLKRGGVFCLDTPNRLLTKIHTRDVGGGFIHPEHYIEYEPAQLRKLLEDTGFVVKKALGICEMPETVATDIFHYEDFMFGSQISENINESYIQFFYCVKPL